MDYLKKQVRSSEIDIMRGLCMLLVILGHSLSMNMLNITILSFHMMAFYFISGLCYKASAAPIHIRIRKKQLTLVGYY